MADSDNVSAAAAHEPPHVYKANEGYDASVHQEIPSTLQNANANANTQEFVGGAEGEDDYEDDYDEIFNSDDDDLDNDGVGNLTKNYNRQRQLNDGGAALPKFNQQKPSANTFASIDDQIKNLSKHAAKIRLDDVKDSQERDKDKSDRATSEQVLDQGTRMILLRMIQKGVVSEVNGAISTGKEANVYGAVAENQGVRLHRAVKIYKTAILSFKDRERYITGEHRFKSGAGKGNNRKMVQLWAEKEYRNLRRIHASGIPCPEPFSLKLHVLVMGFLGDRRGYAYPRLHDTRIEGDDTDQVWRSLYLQLMSVMRRMYQVCKLVHADLSEYNILYNDQKLYIIDVSQSVEHDHPRSLEFLRMDIKNTGDFFRKQGVDTLSDRVIFDFITAPGGTVEDPGMLEALEMLYTVRPDVDDTEGALAEQEIDNEVFRNQYIPQTLEQVYDIEKDAQKIGAGQGDQLVYRNLLANQAVAPRGTAAETAEGETASSEEDDGEGAAVDSDASDDDESRFEKGTPRGKRFVDKDDKKSHKQAVKDEKREKRKEKMPKHLKKQLVSSSSRRKK